MEEAKNELLLPHEVKIRAGLSWKRKHFVLMCLMIIMFLMVKLEFSYTKMYASNIIIWLIIFIVMDIFIEQLLVRVVFEEALLIAPVFGSFLVVEFIMTMGAESFQEFIFSHFIETAILVLSRTYVTPLVEKLEHKVQRLTIWASIRNKCCEKLFHRMLKK